MTPPPPAAWPEGTDGLDPHALVSSLVSRLAADLDVAVASAAIARDEATSEHAKAENKYDTRAIEAGYLAGAQARRVTALQTALGRFRVMLEHRAADRGVRVFGLQPGRGPSVVYVLAAAGAGTVFEHLGAVCRVVTPESPLGRALVDAEAGDVVSPDPAADASFVVAWVWPG